jgi:hypothetical protein
MHAKPLLVVGPTAHGIQTGVQCQALKTRHSVFVRVLRDNWFVGFEIKAGPIDRDNLSMPTDQMHFDPLKYLVVKGVVPKISQLKIRVQFPIGTDEQIPVECRRDSFWIVVGSIQNSLAFLQIHADQ